MSILNFDFTKFYVLILVVFAIAAESKKTSYHSGRSQLTRVGKRYGDDSNYSEGTRPLWNIFPRVGRSWANSEDNQDKIWYRTKLGSTGFMPNIDEFIDPECILLNNENGNHRQYGYNSEEQSTIEGGTKFSDDRQPLAYFEK